MSHVSSTKKNLGLTSHAEIAYERYTVGIVCVLDFEMCALRCMLDKEHTSLPSKPGDSNLYILGELSGHNVTIARLPGTQGKSAAAVVAKDMARSFPSIDLRLIVGIGGGVSSLKNDIRLGDVVVSMPDGQHGGVVQYDLGKNTDDGITLKGFLWPPPGILRSAVSIMRSDHRVSPNKIPEYLSAMFQRGDDLQVSYQRPVESDELFQSDYRHISDQETCQFCDKTRLVNRLPREPTPKIHYGLIASGDQAIRSALIASDIARRVSGDILCFEMEAAGIATEYSCIAIRGISNYADSHKNDAWQHYAAGAAAGCAKELLSYVDPLQSFTPTEAFGRYRSDLLNGRHLAAPSIFHGQGVQNLGCGCFSGEKDLYIDCNSNRRHSIN